MAFELIVYLHGAPTIWSSHLHSFAIKCGFKLLSFYILFLLDFVLIVFHCLLNQYCLSGYLSGLSREYISWVEI